MRPNHSNTGRISLLQAFLISLLVVALLFALLVAGIWISATNVLHREQTLVSQLLPQLDSAYQLTAATADLPALSLLLRSSENEDELERRRQQLERAISLTQDSITTLDSTDVARRDGVTTTMDDIARVAADLAVLKQQQINLHAHVAQERQWLVDKLTEQERDVRQHMGRLTEQLISTDELMLQLEMQDKAMEAGLETDGHHRFSASLADYEGVNLAIQDYLLFMQDIVSLSGLVEHVPLLVDVESVHVAEQRRDLLLSALVSRSIYMTDGDTTGALLLRLNELRVRLRGETSLFGLRRTVLTQERAQITLSEELREKTAQVLEQADQLRNTSRSTVNQLAQSTLEGLSRYRTFLLSVSILTLAGLIAISYWLLYRKTVVPLVQITRQLDDVGTDCFPAEARPYLFKELSTLSAAITQLNTAQKAMQAQDAVMLDINKDLQRANEELEQFAHIASHDLQEPLRKLQQFSDLLEEDYYSKLGEDGRFFVDTIRKSAQSMSRLIKETLAYSRAGGSNQVLESIDLSNTLLQLLEEMDLAIHESGAQFHIAPLPVVRASHLGMAQLFRNLMINALKYSKPDTAPVVTISSEVSTQGSDKTLCISVQDNGVGIADKHQKRIFTPFERMHSGKVQGTGLGLAICSKVCASHGWNLDVKSVVGEGTTFAIHIPQSSVLGYPDPWTLGPLTPDP